MSDVVVGADGLARCRWGATPPEYQAYHDHEWGRPVADERRIFEKLCLEGFQSGLSWLTILRKREAFRRAFAGFEPAAVARFGDSDIARLLADAGIVRHRGKIVATIENARAAERLHTQGRSLGGLLWSHAPRSGPAPKSLGELVSSTPESKAASAELRGLGFRFVGPTTVHAAMQALGVVNDHLARCHFREAAQAERTGFRPPT
ncbi:MAG TPA: DNA-3-methyladenine glycosylase I [Acidimicrobiales bacterium]|nr:DNA-3-methyladenine glycosylase I [Acidimicrobiales bacterium]